MVAIVSDKASGTSVTVNGNDIVISRPSTIKLMLAPDDISSTTRSGNNLLINLADGEQIRIEGFYQGVGDDRSELVLEDASGNLWTGDYTDALADFQFEPGGAVDQLVGGAAAGGGGASILGLALPLALVGAGLGIAGGGGGSGDDQNPGSGPGLDSEAPGAPGLQLGDGDNFLNAGEVAGGNVTVTVSLAGTGAQAGNVLTVNGVQIVLTDAQIAAGAVQTTVAAPADGQTLTVTATLTDAAGNVSLVSTVEALVDMTAPGEATVSVGNGDGVVSASEVVDGAITLSVGLSGTGAVAGDTLTVNGISTVLTAQQISAGTVTIALPAPADGGTLTVTTSLTDAAGNMSPVTTTSYPVDMTAPGAPSVALGDGDAVINAGEVVNGLVTVSVGLVGTGVVAGDTLTVNGTAIVLTASQIAAGAVTTSVTAPANGETLTVTASLSDAAGNSSAPVSISALINSDIPGAPGITLGTNGDAYLNASEVAGGVVSVSVTIAGTGAEAGDTLLINGAPTVLSQAQIDAGVVTTTVSAPADGQSLTVIAALSDPLGNASAVTTVTAVVDTTAPGLPGLSVGNGDALLNAAELAGGTVAVSVSLVGTGAVAGDTLTINGAPIVLSGQQITDGVVTVPVPVTAVDGQPLAFTAQLTDAAGNVSPLNTLNTTVDTTSPGQPTIAVGNGLDLVVTAPELVNGAIPVRIGLSGTNAAAGDILTVNGSQITLSAQQIADGFVATSLTTPPDGTTLTITAALTDAAGNPSGPVSVDASIETDLLGAPTITLGSNGDAYINAGEISGNQVSVAIGIAGTGAVAGDTLAISGVAPIVLTAQQIIDGTVTVQVTAPANGAQLTVTAQLTDTFGVASPTASASALVDTVLPGAPAVTLGNGDGFILAGEIVNGSVSVSVGLAGTGAVAGDSITLNGITTVLTQTQIDGGGFTTTVPVPANGQTLSVSAFVTDMAGNASPATPVTAIVDTTAPGLPAISLGINGDALLNGAEVAGGTVAVSVSLAGTGALAGDRITIAGITSVLTAGQIASGIVTATVAAPANGQPLTVTAQITDAAGNPSGIATATATVDAIGPNAPGVSLGTNNDLYINASEVVGGQVAVGVSLAGTGALAGDRVTVNGITTVLTQAQIDAGVFATSVTAPADGDTLTVSAQLTDPAGNPSGSTTIDADADLSLPGAPTVTLGSNGDAFINAAESVGGNVALSISFAGTGAVAGDRLIVNGAATVLTQSLIDNGMVLTLPAPADGDSLTVTTTLQDVAGNSSAPVVIIAEVDTSFPLAPGVTLGDGNGPLGASEVAGGVVSVAISLAGTNAEAGDTLLINGAPTVLTQTQIDGGIINITVAAPADGQPLTVTAALTDVAGNASAVTTVTAVVDTTAPGLPGLSVGNGDALLNAAELAGGTVAVSVSLVGTGAVAGDTLTINGAPIVLSGQQITDGVVTVPVPVTAVDGQPLAFTAQLTDAAGNVSPLNTLNTTVDTTSPGQPTIAVGNGLDLVVTAPELVNGAIPVRIGLSGTNAAAGDILTVNGSQITLSAQQIADGFVATSLTTPPDGTTLTITAALTDAAGNPSGPVSVDASIETDLLGAPTITLGSNGDAYINAGEISGNQVSVAIGIAGTGAVAGDTLAISGVAPIVLTAQQIIDGTVTVQVTAPANGAQLTVTAQLTDTFGVASPTASASALVDTVLPGAPAVTLGNGDGFILAGEIVNGSVSVSVGLAGTGAVAGDSITLNGITTVLTQTQIDGGGFTTTVPVPANGQTLSVSAFVTDMAGNASPATPVTAIVDTTAPGLPAISLGINGDALLNGAEVAGGTVAVSVSLAGTGALAGDRITIAGITSVLTAGQIASGIVTATVAAPANGQPLTVTAQITDAAGNPSGIATATATVDSIGPNAPGVTLGTNNDLYINASEVVGGQVAVTVSLAGTGALAGDRVTVNGVTTVLTQAQIDAGVFATSVNAPATGATLSVIAQLTDAAGNASGPITVNATVDLTPPPVPTVTFFNDTGAVGDGISTNGDIRVSGIETGATWEYSLNGGASWTIGTGTGFVLPVGIYDVQVRQTDIAGNTATRSLGAVRIFDLIANDDAATASLTINQIGPAEQMPQSGSVSSVLSLGLLGNIVDVSLLTGQSPLNFVVADNTTQQVSLRGGGVALAALSLAGDQNYDLMVYRVEDGQTQAQRVFELPDWLVYRPGILGLLLPSWAAQPVALPQFEGGGTYYVVLGNGGALVNLAALANVTVETTSNVLTDYSHVSGTLTGNVLTGDTVIAGTIVSGIDQTAVGIGAAAIHGEHGTLTISQSGAYTYVADPVFTGVDGAQDVFTYTIRAPDGSIDTATLTVTIDYPHGPQALMSAMISDSSDSSDSDTFAFALADDATGLAVDDHHAGPGDLAAVGTDAVVLDHVEPAAVGDGSVTADAGAHVGAGAGADAGADVGSDIVMADLMIDHGGQEIDLSGVVSSGSDGQTLAAADGSETAGVDPSPVVLTDLQDIAPLDPFEPVHRTDDDHITLPVV